MRFVIRGSRVPAPPPAPSNLNIHSVRLADLGRAESGCYRLEGRAITRKQLTLRQQAWFRSPFAIITLAVLVLIFYWTLYPFDFHVGRSATGPWRTLVSTFRTRAERTDIVANILLFIPLGFFAMQSLRRRPVWWDAAVATAGGALLSTGIELAQFYDRGRQSSLSDVYSNAAGACLGAAAGVLWYRRFQLPAAGRPGKGSFEILLLACWLAYRLYPYDLGLNLQEFWHGIQPLIDTKALPFLELYRHVAVWLVVALLIEAVAGARRWLFALVVVPAVLASGA